MSKWRIAIVVLVVAAFAVPESQAAYYKVLYKAKRDGNLKIWRTKDGVRPSPDPAVDQDMLTGDTAVLNEDWSACNDHDLKWTNAAADKKCNMVGTAYSYNTFGDFLEDRPGVVRHYALMAVPDIEIDCNIELEVWDDFLETNPLPDEAQVFNFVNGFCPELPGYMVTETVSGLSFNGGCEVEITCVLMREAENVPALSPSIAILLIILLSGIGAIFWRRRVRA